MTAPDQTYPKINTVGLDGVLVTFAETMSDQANCAAIAFHAHIAGLNWPEVLESAGTLVSAFFRIDLVEHDPDRLIARLRAEVLARDWFAADLPGGRRLWTIPAVFGGPRAPQLAEAAALAGVDEATAQQELARQRMRVLTIGFAPGQPYLGHLPAHWNIPRQTDLTAQVPPGALVVAVAQFCLFTNASPTGWRHVGQTAFRPLRPEREQPFVLRQGDEVRFEAITTGELERIEAHPSEDIARCEPIS